MFALRRAGLVPSKVVSVAACACVLAPAVLLSGCASDKSPSYVQGPSAQQAAEARVRKAEMEDDGQPVQSPPARAMRPEEDDPSQPWSRNYGGTGERNAAKPNGLMPASPLRAPSPYVPVQVDAAMAVSSTGSLTRLSEADADMVIARAINAHEMRRQ